jgi:hypothetical protein
MEAASSRHDVIPRFSNIGFEHKAIARRNPAPSNFMQAHWREEAVQLYDGHFARMSGFYLAACEMTFRSRP